MAGTSSKPSHIHLPPTQNPADVFSQGSTSALDTTTPSISEANSPAASPFTAGKQKKGILTPGDGSSSAPRGRRTTFTENVSPGNTGGAQHSSYANNPRRARTSVSRNSFASSTARYPRDRRFSRASTLGRRVSAAVEGLGQGAEGESMILGVGEDGKVAIPTLVVGIRPAYSTPLPMLPMVVLSVAMMSELLSANVCTPFLLQMVEGFFVPAGQSPTSEQGAAVGLWTGNLVSVFYITQFLTSLLWSGIADRHGRRAVLVGSLLGSALSVITFGTSGSLPEAISIRLVQGIFGGSIGVVRGSIRDITDSTNETRAYAILSFCWGLGGVIGPILGGVLESPAKKFPGIFGNVGLLKSFPYLLPTFIAGVILSCGAVLATGLSWDGGPRRKKIALPIEKDEPLVEPAASAAASGEQAPTASRPESPSPAAGHTGTIGKKPSSVFVSENVAAAAAEESPAAARMLVLRDLEAQERARRASRSTMAGGLGYGGIRVKREFMAQQAAAARRNSSATMRYEDGADEEEGDSEHMNLAERFLFANEQNMFNLNDLWVSAAIAQETAVFDEDEDEEEEELEEGEEGEGEGSHAREYTDSTLHTPLPPTFGRSRSVSPGTPAQAHVHERSPLLELGDVSQGASSSKPRLGGVGDPSGTHPRTFSIRASGTYGHRRPSAASGMPSIFSHTGLQTPPAIAAAYEHDPMNDEPLPSPSVPGPRQPAFEPIIEGVVSTPSKLAAIEERPGKDSQADIGFPPAMEVAPESGWKVLPMLIIVQYGLLALHDTVHGQIFLSFIFTDHSAGGLGLMPANFSLLTAVMCLFQMYYQFYLYPHLGPPRGRLSHLQMFRLGSILFIPAYLTLPLLRAFVTPDKPGGPLIMTLLTINMACRYAGGTFGYTSIMVLINAMSPPQAVGLANGLAQSLVSLSRFTGPVIGGAVWSSSIRGNPEGFAFGFYVVAAVCACQVTLSYMIR